MTAALRRIGSALDALASVAMQVSLDRRLVGLAALFSTLRLLCAQRR
jgi:hypothetical protein